MRGSIMSSKIRSGCVSATAANALNPSLAVTTSMRSRWSVNCTILRTVGLSSTTKTTGFTTSLTSCQRLSLVYCERRQRPFCLAATRVISSSWLRNAHACAGFPARRVVFGLCLLWHSLSRLPGIWRGITTGQSLHFFIDLAQKDCPQVFVLAPCMRLPDFVCERLIKHQPHQIVKQLGSVPITLDQLSTTHYAVELTHITEVKQPSVEPHDLVHPWVLAQDAIQQGAKPGFNEAIGFSGGDVVAPTERARIQPVVTQEVVDALAHRERQREHALLRRGAPTLRQLALT